MAKLLNKRSKGSRTKSMGQVFTPDFIVDSMLNYCNYAGARILGKHIVDNSCGDGAFLQKIVRRYIAAAEGVGINPTEIVEHLEMYIHGIDNDKQVYDRCLSNLNQVAQDYGLPNVKWDVYHADALTFQQFNGKMDFVVGNPPYVRVHNLDTNYDAVRQYQFANGGMTDLYLAFFEIGFRMLAPYGELCYITPSSWLTSVAAQAFRMHIVQQQNLIELIDLEHFQAFQNATTYTLISHFRAAEHDGNFNYYVFDGATHCRFFIERLNVKGIYLDSCFYLGSSERLSMLHHIKTQATTAYVRVKNGFATLNDSVFINDDIPDSPITIPVLKGSTGRWYKGLFPYDKHGKPLAESCIFAHEEVKAYLQKNKERLLKGRSEYVGWYLYGRTQALSDVARPKLSVNSLVRTEHDFKLIEVEAGAGIYSGLYVITDSNIGLDQLKEAIASPDFIEYVKMLRKYKSGGYYTFSSKDLEQYLNHYFTQKQPYVRLSSLF